MEWLLMIVWPHYVPRKIREDIQRTMREYFRQAEEDSGYFWRTQYVDQGGAGEA